MEKSRSSIRALGLISGGLDSMLAAAIVGRAGLRVECVHFETGFGRGAYSDSVRRLARSEKWPKIHTVDVGAKFFESVLLRPRFGYGSAMNPCIDCRIFMLRRARAEAHRRRAELLFTGEVIGQRAMGQSRSALSRIERLSGLEGRLLRPLCAAHFPPTLAERQNILDGRILKDIHGASRRRQFELAAEIGLTRYPTPAAGCCLLADKPFARRLRDELAHRSPGTMTRDEIDLLRRGRHFRLSWDLKTVLGRDREESSWLEEHAGSRWRLQVADGRGSYGLLVGDGDAASRRAAASLAARYSRHRGDAAVDVLLRRDGERQRLTVRPATEELIALWRL
jgi:hypothetical protein